MKDVCVLFIMINCLETYEELLEKDWAVSIHHKNIQSLAIVSDKTWTVS